MYYKATRPNGESFHNPAVVYVVGETVTHPQPGEIGGAGASGYLSIATEPTDCTGFSLPAKIFEVEPVGEVWAPHSGDMPNKRATHAVKVVRELDVALLLGLQAHELVAFIERCGKITYPEATNLRAARGAAWDAARGAARGAAWDAARGAAWDAARDAAWGLVARDLIGQFGFTQGHYDFLTGPWRKVIGKLHAEDAEL